MFNINRFLKSSSCKELKILIMKNINILKGLSIEELQERNEFTVIQEDASCVIKGCCGKDIVLDPEKQ